MPGPVFWQAIGQDDVSRGTVARWQRTAGTRGAFSGAGGAGIRFEVDCRAGSECEGSGRGGKRERVRAEIAAASHRFGEFAGVLYAGEGGCQADAFGGGDVCRGPARRPWAAGGKARP